MNKIAFLFIDQSYSVYHAISAAITLSKSKSNAVTIFCTPRNRKLINQILSKYSTSKIKVFELRPYWYVTLPLYLEIKLQYRKQIIKKYSKKLNKQNVICCTLYNDLEIKNCTDNKVKLVFFSHGIVNRPYSFDNKIKEFDLYFISGNKEYEIRTKFDQITHTNHATIGYLKHELLKHTPKVNFFENSKKTFLYNPHWEKNLSSFYKYGFKILDFFKNNKNYNLIFAPHSLLFVRNKLFYFKLLRYYKSDNILIDLGSERCNDMSYTKSSDAYIGDVSSQAWEFLLSGLRPCLFINTIKASEKHNHNYLSWSIGEVITNLSNFDVILRNIFVTHQKRYLETQRVKVKEMFYQSNEEPSELAARAIEKLLKIND